MHWLHLSRKSSLYVWHLASKEDVVLIVCDEMLKSITATAPLYSRFFVSQKGIPLMRCSWELSCDLYTFQGNSKNSTHGGLTLRQVHAPRLHWLEYLPLRHVHYGDFGALPLYLRLALHQRHNDFLPRALGSRKWIESLSLHYSTVTASCFQ